MKLRMPACSVQSWQPASGESQEVGRKARQLAHRRRSTPLLADSRSRDFERQTRPSDSCNLAWLRAPTSRASRSRVHSLAAARRALGHSRSRRQRRAHSNGSFTGMGEATVDDWIHAADRHARKIFRCVCRAGKCWGDGVTERVVWHVVKLYAAKCGFAGLAPHDLRRSCAKLCHSAGGELEQIQFLLGHVSVQTTGRYLGCKQRIHGAVNDRIGIEP
jgi:integrase